MLPRYLLDTHIVVRWLLEAKKLTREQTRVLEETVRRKEPFALSAISLMEIAGLASEGKIDLKSTVEEFFAELQANPVFVLLPLSFKIAAEMASLRVLRDPADRVIVATARVHRLKLVTSDQRIEESGLVPVVV